MQARAVLEAAPEGNYVMIKGSPTDPNADFLRGGQQEVLQEAIDSGKIKIVGEAYTDGWLPANAQRNMEQILTAQDNKVDAVVASNDGTAGGVVAALTAQGMEGIPVSGQDGDHAALNRVAKGTQTVSVWKDARDLGHEAGKIAVEMARGTEMSEHRGRRAVDVAGRHRAVGEVPEAGSGHQGQPVDRRRCWLDHQGRALPGRLRRPGSLQLIHRLTPDTDRAAPSVAGWRRHSSPTRQEDRHDRRGHQAPPGAKKQSLRTAGTRHPPARHDRRIRRPVPRVRTCVTDGRFLTSRNIFNLTIQTVSVAIMATGMVFVIVTRHIDLSVGSLLATCSAMMAMTQTVMTPEWLGLGLNHPATAPIAIAVGLIAGIAIGAFQGYIIGYLGVPAFIVTLGGLLVWRNVAWYLTTGQTIGPLDRNFQLFGGINGTLGRDLELGLRRRRGRLLRFYAMWRARAQQDRARVPGQAAVGRSRACGLSSTVAILGFVAILNAYQIPTPRLERMFEARGESMPEGYTAGYGLPISVLLLIAVAVIMTIVARRTRLGRYIFATGGNPDAAELSGINTRLLTVKVFAIMGALCALVGGRRLGAPDLPLQRHRHAGRTARHRRRGHRRHGACRAASAPSTAPSSAR